MVKHRKKFVFKCIIEFVSLKNFRNYIVSTILAFQNFILEALAIKAPILKPPIIDSKITSESETSLTLSENKPSVENDEIDILIDSKASKKIHCFKRKVCQLQKVY